MVNVTFRALTFDRLSARELYDLLALRTEVFVVEQECAYQEVDGLDPECTHMLGERDGELLAYARWYETERGTAIGRIVTRKSVRHEGIGRELVAQALDAIGGGPKWMYAQTYLVGFYRSFGFEIAGEEFLEDGVPHVRMVLL